MTEEQLQLEISLNIGSQRYEIKVPKKTDLSVPVQKFLKENNLNPKYELSIIRLVKDKLNEEAAKAQNSSEQQSVAADTSKSNYQGEVIKPRKVPNQESVNNNKTKNVMLSKIQQEIQSKEKENPPESRKVYEKWKLKQKEKKAKEVKPDKTSYETSRVTTQREKHSPDYFYKKGIKFQNEVEQTCENTFKKLYPFKLQQHKMTPDDQERLYSRLSREKPKIQVKLFLDKCSSEETVQRQNIKYDPVKQYVKQQDDKIDREIFKLIKDRSLTPKKDPRSISKSPFRKTMIK